MTSDHKSAGPAAAVPVPPSLPSQAEPVSRKAFGAAINGDVGVEASDYNDPAYFFLNWPSSV
jgi:hypothetical protein